ncbi:MAG: hypothetical protein RI945_266, partial [Candidatus Parcubacteria bacterium]
YIWIGPIDIAIVLLFIIFRQFFKRILNKRKKAFREDLKKANKKEKETIQEKKGKGPTFVEKMNTSTTYLVSFFLGTLLSHTLVYYFRSTDPFQMWPIFLIVILASLANEFLYGIVPDILLFYIALTFFAVFNVPIALNRVNNNTFLISILVSVIATSIITTILQRIYLSKKEFILLILFSIFFPFLLLRLYYINYIPAVPLGLGESGFYSLVERTRSETGKTEYIKEEKGLVENKKFFFLEDDYYSLETLKGENGIYFFSSIISPADVTAQITHSWEKYDATNKAWIKQSEVKYDVSGGREDGYRGYSLKQNISSGEWRVRVLADERLVGLKKIIIK